MENVHSFVVTDNKGNEVALSDYKGKVLLIVNTATGCGFTPQYKGLQDLYEKYKEKGFEILDFPCNQFLGQAPGDDAQIDSFCTLKYNTTFPRFHKIDVKGKNASPLFTYLVNQKHGVFKNVKWNFTKFLVDREGNVLARFEPTVKPEAFEKDIVAVLGE